MMILQFNACYTFKGAGPARPPDNERLSLLACGEETATKKEETTGEMKKMQPACATQAFDLTFVIKRKILKNTRVTTKPTFK
jgi:hypothetical protein